MGIQREVVETCRCDRCGHTSTSEFALGGSARLTMVLSRTAYDGAVGGARRELWLCGRCSEQLNNFLSPTTTGAGYAVVKLPEPVDEEPFDEAEGYGTTTFRWGEGSTVMATFPNGRVWDEDADLDPAQAHDLAAALLAAEIAAKQEVPR